jgi:anaerobic ribonucleoside-triphosphate reductase activating protein
MSNMLRLGHRLEHSEIYGPGIRSVFWTQGCTLACKGCWNTQYWPRRGGDEISVSEVLSQLNELKDIEGITLLGGEPLQQPQACLELIQGCKDLGLSIFLYTGYEPSEFNELMQSCFDLCDIAVTGRYVQELRDTTLRWRGSQNQQVHFISDLYDESVLQNQTEVECHILPSGEIRMVGYAEPELSKLLEV